MFHRKWQQGHMPGALNGYGQSALMLGACSGLATRANVAAIIDKTA
jgi:hypothetical protein